MASFFHLIAPKFDELLRELASSFTQKGQGNVVQLVKGTLGRRFESLDIDDLHSCLTLLAQQGYLSETKLTLMEEFVTPETNNPELILHPEQAKERIEAFKASGQRQFQQGNLLEGRENEIEEILAKLETATVVNLYGLAGVGKTTLAKTICSKWQTPDRKYFVFDLREAKTMTDVYLNIMRSLGLIEQIAQNRETTLELVERTEAEYEVKEHVKIKTPGFYKCTSKERDKLSIGLVNLSNFLPVVIDKIHQLNSEGQSVLFLLDNVEQFTGGEDNEAKERERSFLDFLKTLSDSVSEHKMRTLKVFLTSRTQVQGVENIEVKPLVKDSSENILTSNGITNLAANEKEKLIDFCQRKPLLLNGVSAILRQGEETAGDLIDRIDKESTSPASEKGTFDERLKDKTFDFEEEGIDTEQMCILKGMFDSLPSYKLKVSAVAVSLFCGPFSPSQASAVLDVNHSEAVVLLEGLRTGNLISCKPDSKELMYDIHPLLKRYISSIKNVPEYEEAFKIAEGNFFNFFLSGIKQAAQLLDSNYVAAFKQFEMNRTNYEAAFDLSLTSEFPIVPFEFRELEVTVALLNAMLDEEKVKKLFSSWAEKCEDDGEFGELNLNYYFLACIFHSSMFVTLHIPFWLLKKI